MSASGSGEYSGECSSVGEGYDSDSVGTGSNLPRYEEATGAVLKSSAGAGTLCSSGMFIATLLKKATPRDNRGTYRFKQLKLKTYGDGDKSSLHEAMRKVTKKLKSSKKPPHRAAMVCAGAITQAGYRVVSVEGGVRKDIITHRIVIQFTRPL